MATIVVGHLGHISITFDSNFSDFLKKKMFESVGEGSERN